MGALVCLIGMAACIGLLVTLPAIINKKNRDILDNWDRYGEL